MILVGQVITIQSAPPILVENAEKWDEMNLNDPTIAANFGARFGVSDIEANVASSKINAFIKGKPQK